jgi:hypothetical protein
LVAGSALLSGLEAQSWRTVTNSRQAGSEGEVDVRIKYAAGQFEVRPAERGLLYRMELTYDEDHFDPLSSFRNGTLELGIDGRSRNFDLDDDNESRMDLELGRGVPMDLRMEFGAVQADVDLGGLSLTRLQLTTGASESRIDVSEPNPEAMRRAEFEVGAASFTATNLGNLNAEILDVDAGVGDLELEFSGDWRRSARVNVDMGLGSLTLIFPRDVGVRLEKDTFLTSLDADEMTKRGDYYYSANWESAHIQIDVTVDAAFGGIDVEWVR